MSLSKRKKETMKKYIFGRTEKIYASRSIGGIVSLSRMRGIECDIKTKKLSVW